MTDTATTDDRQARLDAILDRLEAMQLAASDMAPATTDAYGNPDTVASGELIESAWGNSVGARVVYQFPNRAAIKAWNAPNGSIAVGTDGSGLHERVNGAWLSTARTSRQKTADAFGFVSFVAAEFGFVTFLSAVVTARKNATDVFFAGVSFDAPLTTMSVKIHYLDPTGLVKPAAGPNNPFLDMVVTGQI